MRFRTRITIVVAAAFLALMLLAFGVHHFVILPRFDKLEQAEADRSIERCEETIRREMTELVSLARDYSVWDDTYEFMATGSQDYLDDNYSCDYSANLRIDLVVIVDDSGVIKFQLASGAAMGEEPALKDVAGPTISDMAGGSCLLESSLAGGASGVLMTRRGPMLVGGGPILTSEGEAPVRGAVVFGRLVIGPLVESLGQQARTDFHAWAVDDDSMPSRATDALAELSDGPTEYLTFAGENYLETFSIIAGLDGAPAIILRARTERNISAEGAAAVGYSLIYTALASVVLLALVLVLANKWISGPISALTASVKALSAGEDASKGVAVRAGGEVGMLADEFNRLLSSLDKSHNEMTDINDQLQEEAAERQRTEEELRKTMSELERFNHLAVGRENRMIELKREANELARKAGIAPPYDLSAIRANTSDPNDV